MSFEIVMPKWGLSMEEGLISHWLKQEGDAVKQGEPMLEVETEKITNVVEAPASGTLGRILHATGTTLPVGHTLAIILAPGEELPEALPAGLDAAAPAEAARVSFPDASSAVAPAAAPAAAGIRATPAARRLAREHGLELAALRGSGGDGMIVREDVERALAPPPAIQPVRKVTFFSDGQRLDGLLYTPTDLTPGERRAGVVLCAGYTYLKTLALPDIAKALAAAGYVSLIFDYRGFGDSEGPRWRLIPEEQARDVRAALTFLADQQQVNPQRLAVAGLSLGGANAIVAGARDRRVCAVAAIQPFGDGRRWLRGLRRYWEWEEFAAQLAQDRSERVRSGQSARVDPLEIVLPDPESRAFLEHVYREFPHMRCDLPLETAEALLEYCPETVVGELAPRPLLIIHGADDRLVPPDEGRCLYRCAGKPCSLDLVQGMDHFNWVIPGSPGFTHVVATLSAFCSEVLPAQ